MVVQKTVITLQCHEIWADNRRETTRMLDVTSHLLEWVTVKFLANQLFIGHSSALWLLMD